MDKLVEWLERIDDCALGCVVHIGAGTGAVLEQYAALPEARRPLELVLIEGDPETARSLERAAAAYPWAQVLPTPVAAHNGPMPWNRFNLRMLNGPLDATALSGTYPRLRRTQTTTLHGEALPDVLATLNLSPYSDEGRINALVFDVPGQESLLLASVPTTQLRQFEAVLLRGCRIALPPNGQTAVAATARLEQLHFAAATAQAQSDSLWPEVLMRFDARGCELAQLRRQAGQQAGELEAALKERDRMAQELQSLGQAKAAADKLAADRLAKSTEQVEQIRRLDVQLADAYARLDLLQQEVLMAEGQLALMKELLFQEPSL